MSEYLIIDEPLPLSQDFAQLKLLGLKYIQEHSGNNWNNLNPNDPGVTILDQVCYALTELGYVNGFPMADILTRKDGKLQIKDQFYLPEEMLTTTPLTPDDYRKYIIDGVAGVTNVEIVPVSADPPASGVYDVYLQIDESITGRDHACKATNYYLNKRRNLAEFFNEPKALHKKRYHISGRIDVASELNLGNILSQLNALIRNYIFPDVKLQSYTDLRAAGMDTNGIFNGPLLLRGWIPASSLGRKRDELYIFELFDLISLVPEITGATGLDLVQLNDPSGIVYPPVASIITVDVIGSVKSGALRIFYKDQELSFTHNELSGIQPRNATAEKNIMFGAALHIQTDLPEGTYRDIESYYSIQNTFPEIFAVGADAVEYDAPPAQIAQSRQLKGYLTLFDQVLANQFSQLANLDRLFSFRNTITDEDRRMRHLERRFPAPYKTFVSTFYYQPLYHVPHIKPLLKDSNTYDFGFDIIDRKQREEKSWVEFKKDPYNAYIRGLMDFMEEEHNSILRRNEILDHLLAQNGESPYIINELIDPLLYAGDQLKGQIIFKSLYLQNLGLLSYYRQKAYNYIGATKISPDVEPVSEGFEERILGGNTYDFIFMSGRIDWLEKIRKQDFINYSALELKLFLLFGLRIQYLNYISYSLQGSPGYTETHTEEMALAQWMIRQRRGVIMIETGLLFRFVNHIPELMELAKHKVFSHELLLFFPAFVPPFGTGPFDQRLRLFFQSSLPVQVRAKAFFIERPALKLLIEFFCNWHNAMLYKGADPVSDISFATHVELLVRFIISTDETETGNANGQ